MTYSDMIHAYFDEGVDASFEDLLFEQLARDPDLRREFSAHVRLHTMVQADALALHAPLPLTKRVFGSLGLPVPAAAAANPSPAAVAPRAAMPAAGRRRLTPFLSHAATALGTACVMLALFAALRPFERVTDAQGMGIAAAAPATRTTPETPAATLETPAATLETPAAALETPATAPVAAAPVAAAPAAAVTTVLSEPAVNAMPSVAETAEAAQPVAAAETPAEPTASAAVAAAAATESAASAPVSAAPAPEYGDTAPAAAEDANSTVVETTALAADATPAWLAAETRLPAVDASAHSVTIPSSFRDVLSNCVFEMRVLNSRSNPRIDLPYSSYSMFKDLAFSVVYRLDEKNSVGLEYGREAFGQAFYSTERIEEPLVDMVTKQDFVSASQWTGALYHRNAVLDWIGATWQHALPRTRLFSAIYPYSRAFLGATRQGPLAKARLGVNIAPTDFSLFSLGVEGSMLRYRYEGVWYTTTKIGVTCGIAVGF